jgi:hypothetical protein
MIQKPRERAPRGYGGDPVNLVKPGQAEMLFIAYFIGFKWTTSASGIAASK